MLPVLKNESCYSKSSLVVVEDGEEGRKDDAAVKTIHVDRLKSTFYLIAKKLNKSVKTWEKAETE